jgi:hypothetical protein
MEKDHALYTLVLPLPSEYHDAIQDAIRLVVIQLTMFLMYYISDDSGTVRWSNHIVMQMFLLIGVAMYWLVFRKLIRVTASRPRASKNIVDGVTS